MSRFVDKSAVGTVDLGPCSCPGTPHESDWAKVRTDLSGSEWSIVGQGDTDRSLVVFIAEWNLEDEDGPTPITRLTVGALDTATFRAIDTWIGDNVDYPLLPNESGGPSRNGSRETASRTPRKTR